MDYDALRSEYAAQRPQLDSDLGELEEAIEGAIRTIKDVRAKESVLPELFRIRLREARVKELDSLYRKAVADGIVSAHDALSVDTIPDLLGARIVCNNVDDVYDIVRQLKTAKFGVLHYAERTAGEKDFIAEPKADGYRGYHLDVVWTGPDNRQRRAELQIRTLLQDAWASFMHDDLYKLRELLPPAVGERARDMSAILSAFDQIANELRKVVETAKVSPASNVGLVDALGARMYAYFSGFRRRYAEPGYHRVRRCDRYEIKGSDARYCFEIEAEPAAPTSPRFVIAGDSGRMACRTKRAYLKNEDASWAELGWVEDENDESVWIARDNSKVSHHHIKVECEWGGVFSRPVEYVVAPWATLYPNANTSYDLVLAFNTKPAKVPIAFHSDEIRSLQAALKQFDEQRDGSVPREYKKSGEWHEYSFAATGPQLDILVLFQP
jgi:ppGpp synthetase/RelA/SpoT-type nucleotidyltranferase